MMTCDPTRPLEGMKLTNSGRRVEGYLAAAAEVCRFTREELPALNLAEDTIDLMRKGFAKG
jgi:hypothetical protein